MALLVPDSALQTDQARKVVMVVGRTAAWSRARWTVGPLIDGLRVIRSGLTATDRVAIAGAQLAMPGMKVQLRAGRIAPQQAEVGAPAVPPSRSAAKRPSRPLTPDIFD